MRPEDWESLPSFCN